MLGRAPWRLQRLATGNYGGPEIDLRLMCEYYLRRTRSPLRLHACAVWKCIRFEDYKGDHAGACETSQLMALRPELVDVSRKENASTSGPESGPRHAPGMAETEDIWHRFEQATRKYWLMSTTWEEYMSGQKAPPFPGWESLGAQKEGRRWIR